MQVSARYWNILLRYIQALQLSSDLWFLPSRSFLDVLEAYNIHVVRAKKLETMMYFNMEKYVLNLLVETGKRRRRLNFKNRLPTYYQRPDPLIR